MLSIHGELVVVVMDKNEMEGTELSATANMIKNFSYNGLARYNRYHLMPGEGVMVPFGSVALIVGIEHTPDDIENPSKRKPKDFCWCSYLTIPILDKELDAAEGKTHKACVASSFSLGCSEIGSAYENFSTEIKTWKASL